MTFLLFGPPSPFFNFFPTTILNHWVKFVRTVPLANAYSSTTNDVDHMEKAFRRVALDNARLYIAKDPSNIYLATMSIHQLLLVAQLTQELGPLAQVSQLPVERAIGEAIRSVQSAKNLGSISQITSRMAQFCAPRSFAYLKSPTEMQIQQHQFSLFSDNATFCTRRGGGRTCANGSAFRSKINAMTVRRRGSKHLLRHPAPRRRQAVVQVWRPQIGRRA